MDVTDPLLPSEQTVPNAARMYDYHLGGCHNFEVDRVAARRTEEVMPWVAEALRANRAFLGRAVRACLAAGVRQFLDLGSGIPTVGNVHEIAHRIDPDARIAYVDREPVAVAHAASILDGVPGTSITQADFRDVDAVLSAPGVRDLLDLSRPTALLLVAVLHFLPDDEAVAAMIARYRSALAGGGLLVISHATSDHDADSADAAMSTYRSTDSPVLTRTHAQVAALFDDAELVEPGLVDATAWRPDTVTGGHPGIWAGVGVLPARG